MVKVDFISILANVVVVLFTKLWYFSLFIVILVAYKIYRYRQLSKAGIFEIDKMNGSEFEEKLAILFEKLGYRVERTGKVGDFGVDLVIIKDEIRTGVQAKRYTSHVPESAIQEAFSGMNMYNCSKVMVVTNNFFTPMAIKLAKSDNVLLWDRNELIKNLLIVQNRNKSNS